MAGKKGDDEFDDEAVGDDLGSAFDEGDDATTPTEKAKAPSSAKAASKSGKDGGKALGGIFARLANFIREIVAELQKVIWPTRKELLTYTAVVLVFVALMMTFVAGLDVGFSKLLLWAFGTNEAQ